MEGGDGGRERRDRDRGEGERKREREAREREVWEVSDLGVPSLAQRT